MKSTTIKNLLCLVLISLLWSDLASAQTKKRLEIGDAIPDFILNDQNGKMISSADLIGKQVLVIYFYPKDESMVCTKEACSFRDSNDDFVKAGAKVIGINSGSVASHKSFIDHYNLPFTLLSDPENKVLKQFGVRGAFFLTGRTTYVIGLDGKIAYSYSAMMEGKEHSDQALQFIKTQKRATAARI